MKVSYAIKQGKCSSCGVSFFHRRYSKLLMLSLGWLYLSNKLAGLYVHVYLVSKLAGLPNGMMLSAYGYSIISWAWTHRVRLLELSRRTVNLISHSGVNNTVLVFCYNVTAADDLASTLSHCLGNYHGTMSCSQVSATSEWPTIFHIWMGDGVPLHTPWLIHIHILCLMSKNNFGQ